MQVWGQCPSEGHARYWHCRQTQSSICTTRCSKSASIPSLPSSAHSESKVLLSEECLGSEGLHSMVSAVCCGGKGNHNRYFVLNKGHIEAEPRRTRYER